MRVNRVSPRSMRYTRSSIGKGALAGLIGGLAGAWTMNQFQTLLSKVSRSKNDSEAQQQPSSQASGSQEEQQRQQSQEEDGDATMKAANKLAQAVLHRELKPREKRIGGPIVHYAFGAGMGVLYGMTAEAFPASTKAAGLPFGTVLWATADEAAVYLFGLSGSPLEYPLTSHLSALAAHLVYGVTTDVVRRAARRLG